MNTVSDRHEADVDGALEAWERRQPLRVQVVLGATATQVAVQHTAWMLLNLLARMEGIVAAVHVSGPPLTAMLVAGAAEIEIVPVRPGRDANADLVLEVGPGPAPARGIRVHGDGWAGGIAAASLPDGRGSALPFGPYTAACLAAGRVFMLARAPAVAAEDDLREPLAWSTWSLRGGGVELLDDGPAALDANLQAGLAGVGAVGSAAMHALWAARDVRGRVLAVDGDRRGVDETNLNRGVLFLRTSVGAQKAVEAAARLYGGGVRFVPCQGRYEQQPERPGLLLSAVDRNSAREALQAQYPARAFGASTHGLRVELLRTGPPGTGACLRCDNEPEPRESDAALRARLREAGEAELEAVARDAGVSLDEARRWAAEGGCGAIDAAMLHVLGAVEEAEEDGEFAVAFVSAFAGTLLAGEAVKEALGADVPLHDDANRVTFQFLRPRAVKGPRFAARDVRCPACGPGPAREIWQRRRDAWGPSRPGPA